MWHLPHLNKSVHSFRKLNFAITRDHRIHAVPALHDATSEPLNRLEDQCYDTETFIVTYKRYNHRQQLTAQDKI